MNSNDEKADNQAKVGAINRKMIQSRKSRYKHEIANAIMINQNTYRQKTADTIKRQ